MAVVSDPENDKLTYRWEIFPEPTQLSEGGDFEEKPKPLEGLIQKGNSGKINFRTPASTGAYRLFVYATDGNNNVATANVPFYIK